MARTLFFTDAIIHTGRAEGETAASMLVRDGRVLALDTEPEGRHERIPLGGRHVYPCLIDGHMHLLPTVVLAAAGFDLCHIGERGVEPHDLKGIEAKLSAFAADRPRNAVLVGNRYVLSAIDERRLPSRQELDAWCGGRAVVIYTIDGHASALSTAMLKKLRIDPAGHDGVLMGEAHERVQGRLTDILAASVTPGVLARGIANFHNDCARCGIACVGALEGNGDSKKDPTTRLIAFLAGRFDVDVRMYLQYMEIERARPFWRRQAHARIGGCGDWEMDGATGAHSAAFSLPFKDTGRIAPPYYEQDFVNERVRTADAQGLQIASHAIGDVAVDRLLAALRETESGRMHRVEHGEFASDAAIDEIAARGYALMMQPGYSWMDKRYLHTYEQFLPEALIARLKLKSLYDKGICVCGSSDSPVQELDPWLQMRGMTEFYHEDESLRPFEAFRCCTLHPARALLEEDERGTLEPGRRADFFTADTDIFALSPARLGAFRPLETYYAGRPARRWRGTLWELFRLLLRRPRPI
ncbi:MAG: amidohydrolase family protein [Clostridia bacterium]|nr:amidohydrolase family protein [Clostridia bacterium]